VKAFVDFYAENAAEIAEAAQYIPLNEEQQSGLQDAAASLG
jgi:phosphate transport system substrate-binding protein